MSFITIAYTSGNPINLTLRIAAPQLEQGAFPTSYIPTTTAAATRSADSAVVTPISSFYNQSEGTLFAESQIQGYANAFPTIVQINSGVSSGNILMFYNQAATKIGFDATGFSHASANISLGTVYRTGFALSSSSTRAASNGTLIPSTDSGSVTLTPNATRMDIARKVDGSSILNGHIRKIAYYPRRLSNALLQQLTT